MTQATITYSFEVGPKGILGLQGQLGNFRNSAKNGTVKATLKNGGITEEGYVEAFNATATGFGSIASRVVNQHRTLVGVAFSKDRKGGWVPKPFVNDKGEDDTKLVQLPGTTTKAMSVFLLNQCRVDGEPMPFAAMVAGYIDQSLLGATVELTVVQLAPTVVDELPPVSI